MSEVIGVIGAGYVGAATAAGFAHLGYSVAVVDTDAAKVDGILCGRSGLTEPGLDDLIEAAHENSTITASTSYSVLTDATIVFVCVPTPMRSDGAADLTFIDTALSGVEPYLEPDDVVVLKSTVPVGTGDAVAERLGSAGVHVVNNPEFLREGHTVEDFLAPDRVVVGGDPAAIKRVTALYRSLHSPIVEVDRASAELAKYACNSFLALKLSFVDELATLAERVGADITEVTDVMAHDDRIGSHFLSPGPGWGGSCFPKDTRALISTATSVERPMRTLAAAVDANEAQTQRIAALIADRLDEPDAAVTLLGLTFKAGTADLRESPALDIALTLSKQGVRVFAHDPTITSAESLVARMPLENPADPSQPTLPVILADPYALDVDTRVIAIVTEWNDYRSLQWSLVAARCPHAVVIDTRGIVDAALVRSAGLQLYRIGIAEDWL
ncbi:UDP-glucose/GDP-mannose dehydrogenase family protein [Rhodococcus sovatensis]|uniref:UDP-glucose 6-dehydrogenase n=1 Tax=Rhodococcus sovatensis TaxID=1805840 RepID=A0ABZ2PJN5_9NOCA